MLNLKVIGECGEDLKIPMLGGERLQRKEMGVTYLCPFLGSLKGNLYLTNYKLFFTFKDPNGEIQDLEVPLGFVNRVEEITEGDIVGIQVFCKDVRNLKFLIKAPEGKEFLEELLHWAFPISRNALPFALDFAQKFPGNGWSLYQPVQEFKRLGLPNAAWKISNINEKYKVCESYPSFWGIPEDASEELIHSVAAFRRHSRLPILSWLHPFNEGSLTRCAQPLVGLELKRSKSDELWLQTIFKANRNGNKLFLIDARSRANAVANQAKAAGGGHEREEFYLNIELKFLDIPNFYAMRDSFVKLKEICYPLTSKEMEDKRWLSKVEETQWLEHIKSLLGGAALIVDKIEKQNTSVMIHCSGGWDRTPQLTSLAMLLLDPFYRSIKGFEILVEKEWLSFGHKFQERIGHGDSCNCHQYRSPIFVQWIEMVYHLSSLFFPTAFEFNELFLLTILEDLYSGRFGTFLYNSERERTENELQIRTMSIWSFINEVNDKIETYFNPLYKKEMGGERVLFLEPLDSKFRELKVWKGYFCKWNKEV